MKHSLQLLDSKSTMSVHVFSPPPLSECRDYYFFKIWGDFVHPYVFITKLFFLSQKKRRIFFSFIPARGIRIRILIIKILAVELNYFDRDLSEDRISEVHWTVIFSVFFSHYKITSLNHCEPCAFHVRLTPTI